MKSHRPFPHSLPSSVELVENLDRAALSRSFFNPTHAFLQQSKNHNNTDTMQSDFEPLRGREYITWTSRKHRKSHPHPRNRTYNEAEIGTLSFFQKLLRMREIQYWHISWWIAILFTLGSMVWCANGFIVFLPFIYPSTVPNDPVAGGWTAWVGATIFFFASWPPIWEAWNKDDAANFGWAVSETIRPNGNRRHYGQTFDVESKAASVPTNGKGHEKADADAPDSSKESEPQKKWIWFTSSTEYWHDIGFIGSFVQAWGATIFWISGFTGLSAIIQTLSVGALDGIYWTPQVVGGSGFVIAAILGLLEAQPRWYIPALNNIQWVTSFFNLIGGLGFTLCGVFGYGGQSGQGIPWMAYQSSFCTFWGSFAFLIASLLQWWETVNLN